MIVVIAGQLDDEAVALVEAWQHRGAVLLRPSDLTSEGWVVPSPGVGGSFVASGRCFDATAIEAVVVRLATVDPMELVGIVESDRMYAAAETTALLAHWLDALPARVINRPSPAFLLGPGWSTEEWLTRAARLGVPTVTLERAPGAAPTTQPPVVWATVAGHRVVGEAAGGPLDAGLLALAHDAGVEFVAAGLTDVEGSRRLARVSLTPAIGDPVVREALADLVLATSVTEYAR